MNIVKQYLNEAAIACYDRAQETTERIDDAKASIARMETELLAFKTREAAFRRVADSLPA